MTATQIVLIVFVSLMLIGFVSVLVSLARFYLTPTVGTFTINAKADEDIDAIYDMKLDSHPATWLDRKYVRFEVIYKK
mgnify:CR=1 FL=1